LGIVGGGGGKEPGPATLTWGANLGIVGGGGGKEPGPATLTWGAYLSALIGEGDFAEPATWALLSIYVPSETETTFKEADFDVAIAFGLATRIIMVRTKSAVGTTIFFIGNLLRWKTKLRLTQEGDSGYNESDREWKKRLFPLSIPWNSW
jgi:hypothetical protein